MIHQPSSTRLLVVTDHRFWIVDRGSRQRISSLIQYLASIYILDVLYLYYDPVTKNEERLIKAKYRINKLINLPIFYSNSHQVIASLFVLCNLRPQRISEKLSSLFVYFLSLKYYFSSNSQFLFYRGIVKTINFLVVNVLGHFKPLSSESGYNVIISEYLRLAETTVILKSRYQNAKFLIDTHDVMYLRSQSFEKYGLSSNYPISKVAEQSMLSIFDGIIAISEADHREFSRLMPNKNIILAGHPFRRRVRTHIHSPDNIVQCNCDKVNILFYAASSPPNIDALFVLMNYIFPVLLTLVPGKFRLQIAGTICANRQVQSLCKHISHQSLKVRGPIDESEDPYDNIKIVCNPVRFGGGLKIKNIEAIANKCLLFTSTEGARGLPSFDRPYYISSDNPIELAESIAKFVAFPELMNEYTARCTFIAENLLDPSFVYKDLVCYINDADKLKRY